MENKLVVSQKEEPNGWNGGIIIFRPGENFWGMTEYRKLENGQVWVEIIWQGEKKYQLVVQK